MARATLWTVLLCLLVACNGLSDVIGQRSGHPTPTPPVFATATPGGRIVVLLSTPVGAIATPVVAGLPGPTMVGEIIAPAATATVLSATRQAAAATAAATPLLPMFLPSACPPISAPPPPAQPESFSRYPETIGRYLSSGGPAPLLEATLRNWGALQQGAVVQADTDLTGDAVPEILVTQYDPASYVADQPSPGDLLVYGCSEGGYRLLFSTLYGAGTMIPELRRVGDMNGDVRAELVFSQLICEAVGCTQTLQILSWNATLGAFAPLNEMPVEATNARITIADLDEDGVLELAVAFDPPLDLAAGPQRRTTDIWDWDGASYRLALVQAEAPLYRIHAVHDADLLFGQRDWESAIALYNRVRDDPALQPWTLGLVNEGLVLRAYATYRRMLAEIADGRRRAAATTRDALVVENPPGMPGEVYAALAQAFMDRYTSSSRDLGRACTATRRLAESRPDALFLLNSYGYANRTYAVADLCPFEESP